jgi:hypothetical protein
MNCSFLFAIVIVIFFAFMAGVGIAAMIYTNKRS